MLSINAIPRFLRIVIVIGLVVVGTASLFSTPLAAQDAASTDLTTLNDNDISAYRWEAMAKFYAMQPAVVDLTTLTDGEILTYRWEAMANYYAVQPVLSGLTGLSDADILAHRWDAMAKFYAGQPDLVAIARP